MFNLRNSIFYKNLIALYKLNLDASNEVHQIIIGALVKMFTKTSEDVDIAKLQMSMATATGEWLDSWGDYFGIPREPGELDDDYRARILAEIIEPKVTLNAIKSAAARWLNRMHGHNYTREDINIFEPWKQLLKPSQRGTLSGDARMWSMDYWTYAVIDISIPDASELSLELISYLNEVKAAGVKIIWSIKPSWSLIISHWKDDNIFYGYSNIKQIISRSIYRSFMVFGPGRFPGQVNDSYYTDNVLSGDPKFKLSGPQLIWSNMIVRYWNLRQFYCRLREYIDSSTTSFEDLANIAEVEYEKATIGDILDVEIGDLFPQCGKFTRSQGKLKINKISLTNHWIKFVNNIRHKDSQWYNTIKNSGHILPNDGIGNFVYDDPTQSWALWLTFEHILEQIDRTKENTSLEYLDSHRTQVVNSLIKEEAKIDNVLPPFNHKIINLTEYHRNFVNLTRHHNDTVYHMAQKSGFLMPSSMEQNYIHPSSILDYSDWMSIEYILQAMGRTPDNTSFEYLQSHPTEVINALIKQEAPKDNILAPFSTEIMNVYQPNYDVIPYYAEAIKVLNSQIGIYNTFVNPSNYSALFLGDGLMDMGTAKMSGQQLIWVKYWSDPWSYDPHPDNGETPFKPDYDIIALYRAKPDVLSDRAIEHYIQTVEKEPIKGTIGIIHDTFGNLSGRQKVWAQYLSSDPGTYGPHPDKGETPFKPDYGIIQLYKNPVTIETYQQTTHSISAADNLDEHRAMLLGNGLLDEGKAKVSGRQMLWTKYRHDDWYYDPHPDNSETSFKPDYNIIQLYKDPVTIETSYLGMYSKTIVDEHSILFLGNGLLDEEKAKMSGRQEVWAKYWGIPWPTEAHPDNGETSFKPDYNVIVSCVSSQSVQSYWAAYHCFIVNNQKIIESPTKIIHSEKGNLSGKQEVWSYQYLRDPSYYEPHPDAGEAPFKPDYGVIAITTIPIIKTCNISHHSIQVNEGKPIEGTIGIIHSEDGELSGKQKIWSHYVTLNS